MLVKLQSKNKANAPMKRATFANEYVKDLHGQRVSVVGMDTTAYEKNPVLLYKHNHNSLSIGKVEDLQKEGGKLTGVPVFDEQDELGAVLKHKYEKGYMNGFSVGAMPTGISTTEDETIESSLLIEISCVLIPANSDATVQRAIEKSFAKFNVKSNPPPQMEELKIIAKALDVEADASAIVESVTTLKKELQSKGDALAARDTEIEGLKKKLSDVEAAQQKERAELLVKSAVEAKKLLASEEAAYTSLALKDYDAVKSILDSKKAYEPIYSRVGVTEKQAQRDDWTFSDWQKKDPKGLQALKENAPSEFQALLKTI